MKRKEEEAEIAPELVEKFRLRAEEKARRDQEERARKLKASKEKALKWKRTRELVPPPRHPPRAGAL